MAVEAAGSSHSEPSYLEYRGPHSGLLGWLLSTDHKRIGLMYMVSQLTFFGVGLLMGVLMRLEMLTPGKTIMGPDTYNAVFTLHGAVMIFLFVVPGLSASFGNFFLPIHIGAKDVAFPRVNLLSYWLFLIGAVLVVVALFTGGGVPDTGWTFYAPYSLRTGTNVTLAVFAVFILGMSSILTGINFVTTVHRMRAPGMGWFDMPLFVWALYATAWMQIMATPVLGITVLLVLLERVFGIGVFDPIKGGDPILYQHLFWMYSHPAVYIMILPGMGAITEIIPTFSRRTIFGYKFIAISSMAIATVGSLIWGHHMFVSGQSDTADFVFSLLTFLVAIPSAVKVFNWVATLYKGSISLEPPMLFALAFVFLFCIGGFSGLLLGALATDVHLHDTYFVVGHFHYILFGGTGFAFFGALHYWLPKMFGRMYNKSVATVSWGLLFVGFNVFYFTTLVIGALGMPRRYYDYLPQFQTGHIIATVGSWVMVTGILLMFANLLVGLLAGPRAPANPWGGVTLEWQTSSPPPLENFVGDPVVTGGAYDFSKITGVVDSGATHS